MTGEIDVLRPAQPPDQWYNFLPLHTVLRGAGKPPAICPIDRGGGGVIMPAPEMADRRRGPKGRPLAHYRTAEVRRLEITQAQAGSQTARQAREGSASSNLSIDSEFNATPR